MSQQILRTKLHIPVSRSDSVPRPRLSRRLGLSEQGKLTLVSAPAGFGKTTLVSEWVGHGDHPVAWLSLDEGDSEPARFLTYVVAALQTAMPNFGDGLPGLFESLPLPPIESLLTVLLNEIATISHNFVLVLDDYHVLDNHEIDSALTFLIENMPQQMHLVITTREDPRLPLARLRARGQLIELRAVDLRFTPDEAAEFLNQAMGLNLSKDDITALEARTEGWIAGLQLAAISMQGLQDVRQFIYSFTGSHRFILDYLVEEVLLRQSDQVREFLFQTSILDRLSARLCDAVTERGDSQDILELLERGNMLIIPLDNQRQWYRYHHLFAEVLQTYARKEQPEQVPVWQNRASIWSEQNGFRSEAIRYALASGDFASAADLVELSWPVIANGFQPTTWLKWVKSLPDAIVQVRPVLSAGYAWTLLDNGELEAAETRLRDVERWLDDSAATGEQSEANWSSMTVANVPQFQSLYATTASAWSYHALALGDLSGAIQHAQHALDHLSQNDHYWRGTTALFLGMAHWANGDLEDAYKSIALSIDSQRKANNHYFQVFGTVILASIRVTQGRLRDALNHYERAMGLVTPIEDMDYSGSGGQGGNVTQETVNLYVGLGDLYCEWGDLETAAHHLGRGQAASKRIMIPSSEYRLYAAQARIEEALGNWDAALALLQDAERLYQPSAIPNLRPLPALKARILVRQGRIAEALDWTIERGLSVDDGLTFLNEFEYLTLARVRIAEYAINREEQMIQEAEKLLQRLLRFVEDTGRIGTAIEVRILQAIVHQVQGDHDSALLCLNHALSLAEPEGYVQAFLNEGAALQPILVKSLSQRSNPSYARLLLDRILGQHADELAPIEPNQLLVEPLSKRELEVLNLLASGCSNQAIADELVIAISTVKKHVNNIFGKLDVASRTQAINLARDLNLVSDQ